VTTTVVFATLAILGGLSVQRIPLQLMPSGFDFPMMVVVAPYRRSTPVEIEKRIVRPVENALASMDGLNRIDSSASNREAEFMLQFGRGVDMDEAWNRVMDRLDRARPDLPSDFERFMVFKMDPDSIPVVWAGIGLPPGSVNDDDIANIVETRIQRMVERTPGVARVEVWGLIRPWVQVEVSRSAVEATNTPLNTVVQTLATANFVMASGEVRDSGQRVLIRSLAPLDDVEAIRKLPIGNGLHIEDIAQVDLIRPDRTWISRVNGHDTISIEVQKESMANTVDVSQALRMLFEETLPADPALAGFSFHMWWDAGEAIEDSLQALLSTMGWGGLLAIMVLMAFLRRWDLTLLIALAIPLSIGITVVVLWAQGWSINLLTLIGLMLAVGMVVDNAIVVTESIALQQDEGASPIDAAVMGAGQVSLAITLATATSLVVFLPLILLSGDTTITFFLSRLGLPVCYALLASLWAALYGIPAATAFLSRRRARAHSATSRATPSQPRWLMWLNRHYLTILQWSLGHRLRTFGLAMLCFFSLFIPRANVDKTEDTGGEGPFDITLVVRTEPNMSFEEREAALLHYEHWLLEQRATYPIDALRTRLRTNATIGRIEVVMDKDVPSEDRPEIVRALKEMLPEVPGVQPSFGWRMENDDKGQRISIRLEGDESGILRQAADSLVLRLEGVPGILGAQHSEGDGRLKELQVHFDPVTTGQLGVAPSSAAQLVRFGLRGADLPPLHWGERQIDFRTRFAKDAIQSRGALSDLRVFSNSGRMVALATVSDFEVADPIPKTERQNRRTGLWVQVDLDPELNRNEAWERIEVALASWHAPDGVRWGPGNWFDQEQLEAMRRLQIMGMAVVFVFLLLGALFESVWLPWSVVISIPFAFVGSYWLLWLTRTPLDGMAGIGLILLVGIVVNNAIVLIDRVERLRGEGIPRHEAMMQAAENRFRPILMTAATTIVGLLPMALGRASVIGISYTPLARAVIGGLMAATLLTLVLVPLTYTFFDDLREALHRAWRFARTERTNEQPATPQER